MRVLATQEGGGFVPITIAVSIESREELKAIYELGNAAVSVAIAITGCSDANRDSVQEFLDGLYNQLSAYHTRHC